MKKQIPLFAFVVTTSMLFNTMPCKATVWRVNNNPNYTQGCNHCFNDLPAAITAASANDTIHVEASSIIYNAIIIDKPLTIIGTGYFLNENLGLQKNQNSSKVADIRFTATGSGSEILGLYIPGGSAAIGKVRIGTVNNAVLSNITISNCYIEDYLIFVGNPSTFNNIIISKNYFGAGNTDDIRTHTNSVTNNLIISNNIFNGDVFLSTNCSGTISNNVFKSVTSGTNASFSAGINFFNNIIQDIDVIQNNNDSTNIYNNIFYNQPTWLTGGSNYFNINMATVFGTSGTTDGNLIPLGSCINCPNGGINGNEIGVFGGSNPYRLSGIPNIPAIYQLESPLNINQGALDTINISTRSNDITQSQIAEIEYFWDVDLGFNAHPDTLFTNPVADISNGTLYANVPLNLGLGTHILFVRSKDTQGRWSHTNYVDSVEVIGTGIADFINQTGINVYPNPVADNFTIESNSNETLRVVVYTVEGKKVMDKIINHTTKLDTQTLTSGAYILSVWTNKKRIYRTTIIKE
jgi:hypothetical protein